MTQDLTFSAVCDFIKNDDGELIDKVDSLCSVGIICAAASVGPTALPLLGAKNELIKLGKILLTKLTSKKETDYMARMRRMEIAYGLICYTAFFDALDQCIPDDLRETIALSTQSKTDIAQTQDLPSADSIFIDGLPFPHPTENYGDIKASLLQLYENLSRNFSVYVELISHADTVMTDKLAVFKQDIKSLPQKAIDCFDGQYFELSRQYEEFRIWVDIKNNQGMSDHLTNFYHLQAQTDDKIDVGLTDLLKTVSSIPATLKKIESQNVIEGLQRRYADDIKAPVIKDEEVGDDDQSKLSFPRICDAFIPQSYKVLCYNAKDIRLEQEQTWQDQPTKHNLPAFIFKYLSAPCSIEAPLLVLGHPGGGKSLLTKMLAAQMMSEAYTVIRIPLREVNTDLTIEALAQAQIIKDSGEDINSWASFANQFSEKPLLILLDGFDELLQAQGQVFAGYLDKVQKFQQDQKVQQRPVRVMITSRITLIDKATVPAHSVVLRLLEFNQKQQQRWISIWNKTNARYFSINKATVKPFVLPTPPKDGKHKDKIQQLTEQPLLLLMLALYDSEDNSLHQQTNLDRTVLYDSLLRRFIRRERRRYVDGFDHLPDNDKNKIIDEEMKRLGVGAMGMYNRRKLHVLASELSEDLTFFDHQRQFEQAGRMLSQADLLLGSFFFIHQSKTNECDENSIDNNAAFEFLHNTFGEFLTADFILQTITEEITAVHQMQQIEGLRTSLITKLKQPEKEWFVCLMYSPLYSRPVIPQMIREWFRHLKSIDKNDFIASFDEILKYQLKMVLHARSFPEIMTNEATSPFAAMPLLGLMATYSLNLIILRTIIDPDDYVFDENLHRLTDAESKGADSDMRPWDSLTQLWKSWFSIENLAGLSFILSATRNGGKVTLVCRDEFYEIPNSNRLNTVYTLASTLADDITTGLAGLHSHELIEGGIRLEALSIALNGEGIDLEFEFIIRQLQRCMNSCDPDINEIEGLLHQGSKILRSASELHNSGLIITFLDLFGKARRCGFISAKFEGFLSRYFFNVDFSLNFIRDWYFLPEVICVWLRLLSGGFSHSWDSRNLQWFIDGSLDVFAENIRGPVVAFEYLKVIAMSSKGGFIVNLPNDVYKTGLYSEIILDRVKRSFDFALDWFGLQTNLSEKLLDVQAIDEIIISICESESLIKEIDNKPDQVAKLLVHWSDLDVDLSIKQHVSRLLNKTIQMALNKDLFEKQTECVCSFIWLIDRFGDKNRASELASRCMSEVLLYKSGVELLQTHPEAIMKLLRVLQDTSKAELSAYYNTKPNLKLQFRDVMVILWSNQNSALAMIQLLKICEIDKFLERMAETNAPRFFKRKFDLHLVPTDCLKDLFWYAKLVGDAELQSDIKGLFVN